MPKTQILDFLGRLIATGIVSLFFAAACGAYASIVDSDKINRFAIHFGAAAGTLIFLCTVAFFWIAP